MNDRLPDLGARELRAVTALARNGSFVAAAADLGLSQPGLTRAIRQVETKLGVALFERSTRRVALTPAGREFVPMAERLLADLDLAVRNMRELADRRRGRLVVACLMSVAQAALPDVVAAYRRQWPGIELQIREGVQQDVHADVRSGVADFGVGDTAALAEAVAAEPLAREGFRLCLRRDHALARRRRIDLADLAAETLISMPAEAGIRRVIDAALAAAGLPVAHVLSVGQFGTAFDFIRRGLGVAIVPESAVPAVDDAALTSRPLAAPSLARALGVLTLRGRALSPAADAFVTLLRARFAAGKRRR